MIIALWILHVLVCMFLILVVLLQTGKGADLAGAFGMGGSQTAFGARGAATLLSRLTTISAIVFMVTSLTLAIFANRHGSSVVTDEPGPAIPAQQAPMVPADPFGQPPADANGAAGGTEPAPETAPPADAGGAADAAADPNTQS